ncbi:MAG: hypothetical protein RLZZ546_1231 [Bacteroidota bacterium]
MPKKVVKKDKADVHKDLKGFKISINSFGEMESTFSIDKLNQFLNKKTNNLKEEDVSKEEE